MQARTLQDLGAAIRAARQQQGWTQADLARRAQVSRQWLIGVESGRNSGAEMALVLRTLEVAGVALFVAGPVGPSGEDQQAAAAAVAAMADSVNQWQSRAFSDEARSQVAAWLADNQGVTDLGRLIASHTEHWDPAAAADARTEH